MASALALQCSTKLDYETHILAAGQFAEFILPMQEKKVAV